MDLPRLRFVVGQLGVRRSRHLPEPIEMLLGLEDLSSDWRRLDERRTGISGEPWAQRAHRLGSITAALCAWSGHTLKRLQAQVVVTTIEAGPAISLPGASGESWTWPALQEVAVKQNDRIEGIIAR